MSERMKKLEENFLQQTGADYPDRLFKEWTDSTTTLTRDYPISPGRFVTVAFEGYSLFVYGVEGLLSLRVFENQKLTEIIYVTPQVIFDAVAGDQFYRISEKNNLWIEVTHEEGIVRFTEYRYVGGEFDGTGPTPDLLLETAVTLTDEELAFLYERLTPMEGFVSIEDEF